MTWRYKKICNKVLDDAIETNDHMVELFSLSVFGHHNTIYIMPVLSKILIQVNRPPNESV